MGIGGRGNVSKGGCRTVGQRREGVEMGGKWREGKLVRVF
jgi:hypothetical protein